ncbi:MAG: heavy-metal-associated domain-containing protein [Campylobacteraceae bacterium]
MKVTYTANNINCKNCAKTVKGALEDDFGDITVNLDVKPREVSVTLNSKEDEEKFKSEMEDLGFPIIKEVSRS